MTRLSAEYCGRCAAHGGGGDHPDCHGPVWGWLFLALGVAFVVAVAL